MTKLSFLQAAAASLMLGASMAMPPMGQRHTPTISALSPRYDGDGKKLPKKHHPRHNLKRRTRDWQEYAERVQATHSSDAFGHWQEDPRADKYLHSHARNMRALRRALHAA